MSPRRDTGNQKSLSLVQGAPHRVVDTISRIVVAHKDDLVLRDSVTSHQMVRMAHVSLAKREVREVFHMLNATRIAAIHLVKSF